MADIDTTYQKFVTFLTDQAANSADSLRTQFETTSENLGGKDAPDPLDSQKIHDWFTRQDLYQTYIQCIEKQQPTNLAIAAKLQADFLAQLERDYKLKHMTRVRSIHIAASRRYGHGHDQGVIQKGIHQTIQNWVERQGPSGDNNG